MTRTRCLATLLASLFVSGAAVAAPVDYDCDTPVGSYSELSQPQAGPVYRVRGTITPLQWREDRRWQPVGQLILQNEDQTRLIAVRVTRAPRAAQGSVEVLIKNGSEQQTLILGAAGLNQAVPVELNLSASGEAVVVAGGERRTFRFDLGGHGRVKAVCSTGEFLFSGLDLGG